MLGYHWVFSCLTGKLGKGIRWTSRATTYALELLPSIDSRFSVSGRFCSTNSAIMYSLRCQLSLHWTQRVRCQISPRCISISVYIPPSLNVFAVSHPAVWFHTSHAAHSISNHLLDFQSLLQPNRPGCLNKSQRIEDAVSYGSRLLIIELPEPIQ